MLRAAETLAANAALNVFSAADGTLQVRRADVALGYECHGWTREAVVAGGEVQVQTGGVLSGLSGLVSGRVYLASAGQITQAAPAASTSFQILGFGLSPGQYVFAPQPLGSPLGTTGAASTVPGPRS